MKRATFLLAMFAGSVWAAGGSKKQAPTPPPPPPRSHWDVKGVVLGSPYDAFTQQVQGELECNAVTTGSDFDIGVDKHCHVKGERKCNTIGNQQFCHDTEKIDTFAGVEAYITYGLHDGVVWTINLSGIRPPAFDIVESTMETKYGKPVLSRTDIQNKMGAHFEQAIALWNGLDHIVYEKYTERLDYPSKLTFYSADAWAKRESLVDSKRAAAKQDM